MASRSRSLIGRRPATITFATSRSRPTGKNGPSAKAKRSTPSQTSSGPSMSGAKLCLPTPSAFDCSHSNSTGSAESYRTSRRRGSGRAMIKAIYVLGIGAAVLVNIAAPMLLVLRYIPGSLRRNAARGAAADRDFWLPICNRPALSDRPRCPLRRLVDPRKQQHRCQEEHHAGGRCRLPLDGVLHHAGGPCRRLGPPLTAALRRRR